MRFIFRIFCVVGVAVGAPLVARAYDQDVSSSLAVEGYAVPRADGSALSRRRIVEELGLGAWNLLPGETDPYYRGPRLDLQLMVRLDTDFAVAASETSSAHEPGYVPGVAPLAVELQLARLKATGLWRGRCDAALGRQLRVDTLGFFAFDGVELALHLPLSARLTLYGGYEVRGGDPLGASDFELDGTARDERDGLRADQWTDLEEPRPRLAVGTELALVPASWLDAALAFRLAGFSEPMGDERLAERLTVGPRWLNAEGRFVHSLLVGVLSEADVALRFWPAELVLLAAEYHRFRPVFEGDSIFNVFDYEPQNDYGGRVELRPLRELALALSGYVRVAEEALGLDGAAGRDETVNGVGGALGGTWNAAGRRLDARLSGLEGLGESRLGLELGAEEPFLDRRLTLGLRLSGWRVDGGVTARFDGLSGGYLVLARYLLDEGALLVGELEHFFSASRGQSVAVYAILQLELWR